MTDKFQQATAIPSQSMAYLHSVDKQMRVSKADVQVYIDTKLDA